MSPLVRKRHYMRDVGGAIRIQLDTIVSMQAFHPKIFTIFDHVFQHPAPLFPSDTLDALIHARNFVVSKSKLLPSIRQHYCSS